MFENTLSYSFLKNFQPLQIKLTCSSITSIVCNAVYKVNSHAGIKDVFLLGHRQDGAFGNTLDHVWYASTSSTGPTLLADIQALFAVGDDLLATQQDRTSVVTVGANVRIQRLDIATLVVIAQPPHTCTTCQDVISACAHVLTQCKSTNTPSVFPCQPQSRTSID